MTTTPPTPRAAFAALRRFAGHRHVEERCALCGAALSPVHRHLIEPARRRFLCSCDPCAVLFGDDAGARYRALPRRFLILTEFRLTDAQWDGLMVPINM